MLLLLMQLLISMCMFIGSWLIPDHSLSCQKFPFPLFCLIFKLNRGK